MYDNLITECKQAYKDRNMLVAYSKWTAIHSLLEQELDKCNNEEERYKKYNEFHQAMSEFTNDEVYGITDWGKEKAYDQMAKENAMNGYEKVDLAKISNGEDLSEIIEFCEFYEWLPVKSDNGFNILDLQLNKMVEDEDYKTFTELVNRIVGRAIDYYNDEQEWEDDEESLNYGLGLYRIADNHKDGTEWEEKWLENFKKNLENS